MDISNLNRDEIVAVIFSAMKKFPVLAGRVTPEQASAIASDLALVAYAKRDPITVEVGGMYRTVRGDVVTISSSDGENEGRFLGDNNISYTKNGRWSFRSDVASYGDIIEMISR